MSAITTHILDLTQGRPAEGVPVVLEFHTPAHGWHVLASGVSGADGRLSDLLPEGERPEPGSYRLTFDTDTYFAAHDIKGFYPAVTVVFTIEDPGEHYHLPLLLSRFGYSTYRGS